ncbi:MAG TPA: DUF3302 domain-containing protein [Pararobbsia sp.]|jgi:hypothetical protein|nr:DUF3302 domain-containing protein [Pararobbsia sp.]
MGLLPLVSHAASAHPFEDTLANAISWVAITVMPVVAIYLFWKIHVLPEVIAEKRHHPQAEAIKVLCLLSLVFGGLLWPLAWLWAYMKPIQVPIVRGTRRATTAHERSSYPDSDPDLDSCARSEPGAHPAEPAHPPSRPHVPRARATPVEPQ